MRDSFLHFASRAYIFTPVVLISALASIEKFLNKHPAARSPMTRWVRVAQAATWRNIMEVRASLPHADLIRGTTLTCFNIGGGNFRLLTMISYDRQEIAIHQLLTHQEYDKKY